MSYEYHWDISKAAEVEEPAKPVLVCLGRFGDVYQVCKAAPQPSIIFTSQAFVSIVKQLFPQHEVFVLKDAQASYGQAIKIAETRFPDSDIQPAQQYHMPIEVRSEFRNYQVYQEWQAGKRDFSFQPMKFPMNKVKKAIIHLGGVSSPVTDPVMVRRNLYQGLRALGLEVEEYEQQDDFIKAVEYFNQPQTLYIINDSLEYHLCDRSPVIILSRSMQWAQSSPKRNCIGRLTHEQLATDYSELLVLINRASTMRPFADHMPARTYLVFSEYLPGNSDAFKRNGWAQASWGKAIESDYHIELVPYQSEDLPRVNEMLQAGMEGCEHPDDLVIILNRDICLTPEAVGMIRAFMDSRDIDACYLHHVNVKFESLLRYSDIKDMQHDWGVDAFVFRPGSEKANVLMKTPLWLGRTDWDNYWASVVGVRFPYNVIYHYPHTGDWKGNNPVVAAQNTENQRNIMRVVQPSYYDRSRFDRIGPTV